MTTVFGASSFIASAHKHLISAGKFFQERERESNMITRPFGVVKSGQVGDPNSVPNAAAAARHLQRLGSTGAAVIG